MIEFYKNKKYKVKTPTGFKDFTGIRRTTKAEVVEVSFEDGTKLECSLDHIFVVDGKEILGRDLQVKQKLTASKIISNIILKPNKHFLYDLVGVEGDSLYIADDIVSHNCDFSTSGNTVIAPELLSYYRNTYIQEPTEKRGFDGNLWIWESPDYTKSYIVSADVARGDGTDYSTFHVLDVETCKQVAEYKSQLTTKEFGNLLVAIATDYNDALLSIENANVGWATIQQVLERGYKNLYYSHRSDVLDTDKFLLKGYDVTNKADMVAGFTTSTKTRPLMISKMELLLREREVVIRSKRMLDELAVFRWKSGKAEAAPGYNDDLVLAYCQGLWVREVAIRLRQAGININKLALSHTKSSLSIHKTGYTNDSWKTKNQFGDQEDITWLL